MKFRVVYFSLISTLDTDGFAVECIMFILFVINCPNIKKESHIKYTSTVKIETCIKADPGQSPPIPHPRIKQIAPETNFKSINL